MGKNKTLVLGCVGLMVGLSCAGAAAADMEGEPNGSGNIGIFSKYVFRGMQNPYSETNGPALQGGFDFEHRGVKAGYWGSNLDAREDGAKSGVENEVYFGYGREVGALRLEAEAVYYKFISIDHADAPELALHAGYRHFDIGMAYLAKDVEWGNAGDIYWTAGFETKLARDFDVSAELGYYTYANAGEFIAETPIQRGFRNFNVSIAHAMGHSGAVMSLTGILGGVDRDNVKQGSTAVLGVRYNFEI